MKRVIGSIVLAMALVSVLIAAKVAPPLATSPSKDLLETANPLVPLPKAPLGVGQELSELEHPPTPERVRLGRWLFFDPRLSADGTISCATCHIPEHAFSEPTPVSTGLDGKKGDRKAPTFLNSAFALLPHFFWDGRAASLEEQAAGPMTNPIEMGMPDHDVVVGNVSAAQSYAPYFKEAFGDEAVTIDRITKAIADYERTRMSGNSAWDRWQAEPDPADSEINVDDAYDWDDNLDLSKLKLTDGKHVTAQVKLGHYVFFEKAKCSQCHLGSNFTDSKFHNIGVGWDPETKSFKDIGRFKISKEEVDKGAFKTPTMRDAARHAPFMHDGSLKTLRDVVDIYDRGGESNQWLSAKIEKLDLTAKEIDALVAFMEALNGEGYQDTVPTLFPK